MKANTFHIKGGDSVQIIQDRFNRLFPSMQISFFRDPANSKLSDQCIMLASNVKINEINATVKDLSIEISPKMRVSDFEKMVKSMGLHVQISCRIANRKLPDSSVSNWLLKDVYGVDIPNIANKPTFVSSKWDSIIK